MSYREVEEIMNNVIYLPAKLLKIFQTASFQASDKIKDNEVLIVNTESTIEAFLEGKSQIPAFKACLKFSAEDEKVKTYLKGNYPEEIVEFKNGNGTAALNGKIKTLTCEAV
jgi:hypothetical protein